MEADARYLAAANRELEATIETLANLIYLIRHTPPGSEAQIAFLDMADEAIRQQQQRKRRDPGSAV